MDPQPTLSEANVRQAVPFFMVTNMEASLRFYTEGLGFRIDKTWTPDGKIRWCWLTLDDTSIMLQEYNPARIPTNKLGEGVSVCFQCRDAIALYHQFTARGITVKHPFVGNGLWVVVTTDPDGYTLDFESPTDVPEETLYDPEQHGT
jgi:lactoylglutathione lyase